MNNFRLSLPVLCVVGIFSGMALASDEAYRQALEHANKGNVQQAIRELNKLKQESPKDDRVLLSLGLLYQSVDQVDLAIEELIRATTLFPSPEGFYALGLLYESKMLGTNPAVWKAKAVEAWEAFLKVSPADHPRKAVAQKHLERLQ